MSSVATILARGGGGGGGGGTACKGVSGKAPPKGVPFLGFRYKKEKGFYKLKYMKWSGNLSFRSVKRPQRANSWMNIIAVKKSRKRRGLLTCS